MDGSPPGTSVHGILRATILEGVAILFSRGSSQPRNGTWVACIAGGFFILQVTREVFAVSIMQDAKLLLLVCSQDKLVQMYKSHAAGACA